MPGRKLRNGRKRQAVRFVVDNDAELRKKRQRNRTLLFGDEFSANENQKCICDFKMPKRRNINCIACLGFLQELSRELIGLVWVDPANAD